MKGVAVRSVPLLIQCEFPPGECHSNCPPAPPRHDFEPYCGLIDANIPSFLLKNYRENREHGEEIDNPQKPFPSAGFDTLDIQRSDWQGDYIPRPINEGGWHGSSKWPGPESKFWWKLTCKDGREINDFYWTPSAVCSLNDSNGKSGFIIHHAPSGTKIEGFFEQPDLRHGPPNGAWNLWYSLGYNECGAIKQWMQEKDLRYLARIGDAKTKFELAQRYHKGDKKADIVIEKDIVEAIVWYEKAADLESVDAYLALGEIYADDGEEDIKDIIKAIDWYKKAADLKSTKAYLSLGKIYADGDEKIRKDEKKAITYFRKAAELGDDEAFNQLHNFADTRNRDALCALECTAARIGPNKDKAQKYIHNSVGRRFFDPQRCAPQGEDDCVASPSMAIILGTALGLIGLMVLIWWWYKTPRSSEPNISEMSEDDIQKAIENKDFIILNALLTDEDVGKDMKAWSFIGLTREELYFDDERLLQCGIIFSKKRLLQVTRNHLDEYESNPDINPLYLRRLLWGINRLLQTQRLSSREILTWQETLNQLENILGDELAIVDLESDGVPLLPFHISYNGNSSEEETISSSSQASASFLRRAGFFASSSSSKSTTLTSPKGKEEDVVVQQPSSSLPARELINDSFLCPITQEIMFDPVIATDGHTYEREAILQALDKNMFSPMTGELMESKSVIPSHNTRSMIRDFLTRHPEYWREVYVSTTAINALLDLSSGVAPLDLQKWEAILRVDPRLLTLPLNGVTLLEFLCGQNALLVTTYLPALLNLLKPKDWQDLIQVHSTQDWLKLVTPTCERCCNPELKVELLNKLQSGLKVQINPLENPLIDEKVVVYRNRA